jgi:hypothetical protein
MPNLRDAIERADAEKARKAEQEKSIQAQKQLEEKKQWGNYLQNREKESRESEKHFNSLLMPIFREIASAKKINMSIDPFNIKKKPGIDVDFINWFLSNDRTWSTEYPQKSGFGKNIESSPVYMSGTLVWDLKITDDISVTCWDWRYIKMGVTSEGIVIANFYPQVSILDKTHMQRLWKKVEQLIIEENGQSGRWTHESPSP